MSGLKSPVGLYIHIPFCVTKCNYCNFYSVPYSKSTAEQYKSAVIRNILDTVERHSDVVFDTVFFGGGTPSLFCCDEIAQIMPLLPLTAETNAEITVECNPDDVTPQMLRTLRESQVNRLSIGVQSLDDNILRSLGRRHDAETALKAIRLSQEAGFDNISVDLMLGIPNQTIDDVKRIAALRDVSHISVYMYEHSDTMSDDEIAELYLHAVELLPPQYEISNFGKPCRHNLKYWKCEEYIGIGAAAHSYFGGKRYAVPESVNLFINSPLQETFVTEDNAGTFEERLMLGLRLTEGIQAPDNIIERATATVSPEYFNIHGNRLSLTPRGFLVSNAIIAELLG
jgi:oxygen-independent coproporphyrinogen-3 oxidase